MCGLYLNQALKALSLPVIIIKNKLSITDKDVKFYPFLFRHD